MHSYTLVGHLRQRCPLLGSTVILGYWGLSRLASPQKLSIEQNVGARINFRRLASSEIAASSILSTQPVGRSSMQNELFTFGFALF